MKKNVKRVAMIALLSIAAIGCQKENLNVPLMVSEFTETSCSEIVYAIDGETHQISFNSEEEWLAFLDYLFSKAEEGRVVRFTDARTTVCTKQSREIVTHETRDKQDAEAWAESMRKKKYDVYISYDSSTGIYTCIATK